MYLHSKEQTIIKSIITDIPDNRIYTMRRPFPSTNARGYTYMEHAGDEQQKVHSRSYTQKILIIFASAAIITFVIFKTCTPHVLKRTNRLLLHHTNSIRCVRNVLIDKFPQDELLPAGHDETSRQVITGTLMSNYEGQAIKRFITSVAGVFRPKKTIQHLIFYGLKNGWYLANISSLLWPNKKHGLQEKVTLHLINELDDENAKTFNDIVDTLSLKEKVDKAVRIHDLNSIDGLYLGADEGELPEERRTGQNNLLDIASMIQSSSAAGNTKEIVIPYFHVGGQEMRNQLDLLEGAAPLFLNQNIVTVGIEHTIDMDIDILLHFFNSMKYRLYFLGKYRLIRIDNLCRSALQTMLERPEFEVPSLVSEEMENNAFGFHTTPAFYVAIAGDRFETETRAIQHAYDILGVYSSQPSNAQDRSRERYSSMLASFLRGVSK